MGLCPRPHWEAYSTTQTPYLDLRGLLLRGGERNEGKGEVPSTFYRGSTLVATTKEWQRHPKLFSRQSLVKGLAEKSGHSTSHQSITDPPPDCWMPHPLHWLCNASIQHRTHKCIIKIYCTIPCPAFMATVKHIIMQGSQLSTC